MFPECPSRNDNFFPTTPPASTNCSGSRAIRCHGLKFGWRFRLQRYGERVEKNMDYPKRFHGYDMDMDMDMDMF